MIISFCINNNFNEEESYIKIIEGLLNNINSYRKNLNSTTFEIYKKIQEENKKYIRYSEYLEICKRYNINREYEANEILSDLSNCGYLFHFNDDLSLREIIIISYDWINEAIDKIMNNTRVSKDNGIFDDSILDRQWKNYSIYERSKIIELVTNKKFEIFYKLPSDNKYINPEHINQQKPYYKLKALNSSYKKRLVFPHDPIGIIERIYIKNHHIILRDEHNISLIWKRGIVLEEGEAQVQIIKSDVDQHIIDIEATGPTEQRKQLLDELLRSIKFILKDHLPDSQKIREQYPCNCPECNKDNTDTTYFERSKIDNHIEHGKDSIHCEISKTDIQLNSLMGGYSKPYESDLNDSRKNNHCWYKEWWIVSIVIAVIVGLIAGFAFFSEKVGAISTVVAGIIVYFMNPKRRFYRAAWVLLLLFGTIVTPPMISGYIKSQQLISNNQYIDFAMKVGESMNPWLAGTMAIASLIGAITLFYLDAKQE